MPTADFASYFTTKNCTQDWLNTRTSIYGRFANQMLEREKLLKELKETQSLYKECIASKYTADTGDNIVEHGTEVSSDL